MSTRPSPIGCTSLPGSSGWLPGSGTAYGSGPSSVHRSGNRQPPADARRAAYDPSAVIAHSAPPVRESAHSSPSSSPSSAVGSIAQAVMVRSPPATKLVFARTGVGAMSSLIIHKGGQVTIRLRKPGRVC